MGVERAWRLRLLNYFFVYIFIFVCPHIYLCTSICPLYISYVSYTDASTIRKILILLLFIIICNYCYFESLCMWQFVYLKRTYFCPKEVFGTVIDCIGKLQQKAVYQFWVDSLYKNYVNWLIESSKCKMR